MHLTKQKNLDNKTETTKSSKNYLQSTGIVILLFDVNVKGEFSPCATSFFL